MIEAWGRGFEKIREACALYDGSLPEYEINEAVENRQGENSYWMRSIMFSKWWLPLMLIYVKDGKNYSSFYNSNHFHDFFKNMRTEPEQEQEQLAEQEQVQETELDDIFW